MDTRSSTPETSNMPITSANTSARNMKLHKMSHFETYQEHPEAIQKYWQNANAKSGQSSAHRPSIIASSGQSSAHRSSIIESVHRHEHLKEKNAAEDIIADLRAKLSIKDTENATLKERCKHQEATIKGFEKTVSDLNATNEKLQTSNQDLGVDNIRLRDDFNFAKGETTGTRTANTPWYV